VLDGKNIILISLFVASAKIPAPVFDSNETPDPPQLVVAVKSLAIGKDIRISVCVPAPAVGVISIIPPNVT
jgi:hypothetical protein